jgi:hypothetical protein
MASRHQNGDERRFAPRRPHDAVFLSLDSRQCGFGDFSAHPLPPYRVTPGRTTWSVVIRAAQTKTR